MGLQNGKAIEALRARFRGEIVLPGSPGYDDARQLWNGIFDRRPVLVARCIGTHDVIEAVRFAQEHGLPLAVKGGGHNSAGTGVCDDGWSWIFPACGASRYTPRTRPPTWIAVASWVTWTTKLSCTDWPCLQGSSRTPASAASLWAAASAGSAASTVSPSTTCSPPKSSPPGAGW